MNKKIMLFLVMFSIMIYGVVSLSFVDPSPSSSTIVGGQLNINLTSGALFNMSNCTVVFASSLTANTSVSYFLVNTSPSVNTINGTVESTGLEDGSDYTVTASCYNATFGTETASNPLSSLTIDNTVPQTPTSLSPASGADEDSSVTFSVTVTDRNTTSCELNFDGTNPGSSSYAMTHSGTACTVDLTDISDYTYKWYVVASDGTNVSADSETFSFRILTSSNSGGGSRGVAETPKISIPKVSFDNEIIGEKIEKEKEKAELFKTGVGVTAGLIVGTLITPGVGTIVGGIIGVIIGVII